MDKSGKCFPVYALLHKYFYILFLGLFWTYYYVLCSALLFFNHKLLALDTKNLTSTEIRIWDFRR